MNFFTRTLLIASATLGMLTMLLPAVAQSVPTTPAQELMHTMMVYGGYVGQRDDQRANMLKLTFERLERIKVQYRDLGVRDHNLELAMADFEASLFAVKHMTRARDASKAGKKDEVRAELRTACGFADKSTYLDKRLQETCNRFRKNGDTSMT